MAKQFRKPKRRTSPEHADHVAEAKRKADIAELWEVLNEQRPHTPWIPWRSGENAVGLALEASRAWFNSTGYKAYDQPVTAIDLLINLDWSTRTSEQYHQLQDLLQWLSERSGLLGIALIRAALRIAQLEIANSSGGGHAFNQLLLDVDWHEIPDYQQMIRRWRCRDATGIDPDERKLDSACERTRRAFFTAWDHGLYTVAYAVYR